MKNLYNKIRDFLRPWHYSVMRFVGTERSNCNDLVAFIASNRIKVISYSSMLVETKDNNLLNSKIQRRVVSVLIYKTKFVANGNKQTADTSNN